MVNSSNCCSTFISWQVAAEGEGLEGTAPKTVEPLEFVVFRTDELVLESWKKAVSVLGKQMEAMEDGEWGFYLVDVYWQAIVPEKKSGGKKIKQDFIETDSIYEVLCRQTCCSCRK